MNDMSAAQAILTVLSPIAVFLAGVATLVVKRLLRHFDELSEQRKADSALTGEIVVELRLAREDREADRKEREVAKQERVALRADINAIQEVFKKELSDHRHADLKAHLEAIGNRVSQNPPEPRKSSVEGEGPKTRRTSASG